MQRRNLLLIFVLLLPAGLAVSSKSFLAREHSTSTSKAKAQVQLHLKALAQRLAKVLQRDVFSGNAGSGPSSTTSEKAADAHKRLEQEADRLLAEAGGGDAHRGAELFRDYVMRTPPTVWILPVDDSIMLPDAAFGKTAADNERDFGFASMPEIDNEGLFGGDQWPTDRSGATGSSISEETIFRRDGKGNVLRHTTKCKDGMCVERKEVGQMPAHQQQQSSNEAAAFSMDGSRAQEDAELQHGTSDASSDTSNLESSIGAAARHMAGEMRRIEQSFGHNGLESIMDNIMRHRSSSDEDDRDVESPLSQLKQHNATSAAKQESHMDSISSSTEVVVKNGQVVQRTRECKNGNCVTKITHRNQTADGDSNHGTVDELPEQGGRQQKAEVEKLPIL